MQFNFSMPVLIRHLWQLKTVVFLHWGLIRPVPLDKLRPKHLKMLERLAGTNTPAYY